jgi:8-hydroxy-5-deazaflavin:NADPH oxidoreductase
MPASRAETLAQIYPDARIVKAFNAITVDALALVVSHSGPEIGTVYTSGFYCGDDAEAKRVVASLSAEINPDPIDCGPLSNAILLESLGLLGAYFEAHVFDSVFALSVVRPPIDRSPLDRWM